MSDYPAHIGPYRNRVIDVRVMPVSELVDNPRNWRKHPKTQIDALDAIMREVGVIDVVRFNEPTGRLWDGHARKKLYNSGPTTPVLVLVTDLTEEEEELALASFDPISAMAATDEKMLTELLEDLRQSELVMQSDALQEMMGQVAGTLLEVKDLSGVEKGKKPNPRQLPLDAIYTLQMCDCTCCLAVQAGLRYGIQSAKYRICPYVGMLSGRHEVTFVDNDYFNYDHAVHLAAVEKFKPKYATVRDVMTREQCGREGIAYFELEQILDWAEELSEHAQNVIVVPKHDVIDRIPEKFMLGYSVPTSHGGTPLPVEAFRGRRVHLLGGSWKAQLAYLAELGEDVVSLDNNYVLKAANYGTAIDPDGDSVELPARLNNVRYSALALTFGAIGSKLNELYPPQAVEEFQIE